MLEHEFQQRLRIPWMLSGLGFLVQDWTAMMGTSVQQPGAGRDEEVVKIKEISGGGGGVHESEFPLSIQIEGKSRILSVAIISFTAILVSTSTLGIHFRLIL